MNARKPLMGLVITIGSLFVLAVAGVVFTHILTRPKTSSEIMQGVTRNMPEQTPIVPAARKIPEDVHGMQYTGGPIVVSYAIPRDTNVVERSVRTAIDLPPELPSAGLPLHFECTVTNVCDAQPCINRRVSLWYQWTPRKDVQPVASAWMTTNMPITAWSRGTDMETTHECWIPPQKAGYLWYYYMVEFDGYCWSGKMKTSDPVTYDSLSPRYAADGETSSAPPTNAPPSQIYSYRTRFTQVKVPFQE